MPACAWILAIYVDHKKARGSFRCRKRSLVMKKLFLLVLSVMVMWSVTVKAGPQTLMFMPFQGGDSWYCAQGPGGRISHNKQPTLYAYDFAKGGDGRDIRRDPAFGKKIFSPISGTVVQVVKNVPDFSNNDSSNTKNNHGWGNQVIIKDNITGGHVRICHMKQDSAAVSLNHAVEVGTLLGYVGQTGFSTSPHLHIQLQDKMEGGKSLPFTFVEGRMRCSGWNESRNIQGVSVLDNDGSTNLGNDFASTKVTLEGKWDSYKEGYGFNGVDYFRHTVGKNDSVKITWTFTLKRSGAYQLSANWIATPLRDPAAQYTIFGVTVKRDQSIPFPSRPGFSAPLLMSINLNAGIPYSVSLKGTTQGKTITADGILLYRL